MLQRQIDIGKCLRLDSLCGVHNQDRAVAGSQGAAHFVVKIHVSGCVDQIEDIFLSVPGIVDQPDGLGFDRNSALALQFHVIKDLVLHLTAGQKTCLFDHTIRKCGLSMINMCDNTEISDFVLGDFFLHIFTFQSVGTGLSALNLRQTSGRHTIICLPEAAIGSNVNPAAHPSVCVP